MAASMLSSLHTMKTAHFITPLSVARLPQTSESRCAKDKWQKTNCIRYGHSLVLIDPKAEAKLRLKIDFMIVPTVSLLYLFCFIDRANIGECAPYLPLKKTTVNIPQATPVSPD
jgi:hypothetical protein